jgi:hypothetical protein
MRVDTTAGPAEFLMQPALDGRHQGRTTDQQHVRDVAHSNGFGRGGGQGPVDDVNRQVQQVSGELLVDLPGQHHRDGLGAEPDRHLGRRHLGQLDLRRLGLLQHQLLKPGIGQVRRVDLGPLGELLRQPLREPQVPVRATKFAVTVDHDGVDALDADPQHRRVEGAAAQVEHQQRLGRLSRGAPVVQRGRDRLRDGGHHVQPGQRPGLDGGLRLAHPEVRGNGDHHAVVVTAQDLLHVLEKMPQDERGNALRGVVDSMHGERLGLTHTALHHGHHEFRLGDGRVTRHITHRDLGRLLEVHHRRGRGMPGDGVRHHHRLPVLVEIGDRRIGRSQIDSEIVRHIRS